MGCTNVVNLLHHPVNLVKDDTIIVIPTSGKSVRTARLVSWGIPSIIGDCLGAPIIERERGSAFNISHLDPDTYYIVSTMVARELCHPQIISPNTLDPTQVVKSGDRVIGVRSFQTFRRGDHGSSD